MKIYTKEREKTFEHILLLYTTVDIECDKNNDEHDHAHHHHHHHKKKKKKKKEKKKRYYITILTEVLISINRLCCTKQFRALKIREK